MIPSLGERWIGGAKRSWPHVRAILILAHMAALMMLCTPPRHKIMAARNWDGAEADARYAKWADRMSSVGIEMTGPEFKELWRGVAEKYLSVRELVGWPAERYAEKLYLYQGWSLFSSPKREPALIVVDIRTRGQKWQTIYRPRSEEFSWRKRMFDNNRFRKLMGRFSRKESTGFYVPLGNWIAKQVAVEFPDAVQVRTRLWRYKTSPPGKPIDLTKGKFTNTRIINLDKYR